MHDLSKLLLKFANKSSDSFDLRRRRFAFVYLPFGCVYTFKHTFSLAQKLVDWYRYDKNQNCVKPLEAFASNS